MIWIICKRIVFFANLTTQKEVLAWLEMKGQVDSFHLQITAIHRTINDHRDAFVLKMRNQPFVRGLFLVHQKCRCTLCDTTGTIHDCEFIDQGHHKLVHLSFFKRFNFAMRAKHRFTFGILSILKLIKATLAKELVAIPTFNWLIDCARNTDAANKLFNKVNIG